MMYTTVIYNKIDVTRTIYADISERFSGNRKM